MNQLKIVCISINTHANQGANVSVVSPKCSNIGILYPIRCIKIGLNINNDIVSVINPVLRLHVVRWINFLVSCKTILYLFCYVE